MARVERDVEPYIYPKRFSELPFNMEVQYVGDMPLVIGSWGSFETPKQYVDYYAIKDETILSAIDGSGFEGRWGNHRDYDVSKPEHDLSMAYIIVASTVETLAARKNKMKKPDEMDSTNLVVTSATVSLESIYYAKELLEQEHGVNLESVTFVNQACNGTLTAINNTLLDKRFAGKMTTVVAIEQISGSAIDYSHPWADQTAFFFGNGVFSTTFIPGVDLENAYPDQAVTRVRADPDDTIMVNNRNRDAHDREHTVCLPEGLSLRVNSSNVLLTPPPIPDHYRLAEDGGVTQGRFSTYIWNGIEVIDMNLPQHDEGVMMVPQATFKKFNEIVTRLIEEKLEFYKNLPIEEQRKISGIIIAHLASKPVIDSANNAFMYEQVPFLIPWVLGEAKMSNMSGVTPGVAMYWLARLGLIREDGIHMTMAYGAAEVYESMLWHFLASSKVQRRLGKQQRMRGPSDRKGRTPVLF